MAVQWDPPSSALSLGQRITIVVEATGEEGRFRGLWHGDVYFCSDLGSGIWTLQGYQVVQITDSQVFLTKTSGSFAFPRPNFDRDCLFRIRDIYAGIGGFSAGTAFAGCRTFWQLIGASWLATRCGATTSALFRVTSPAWRHI